jgi:acyl carrier protein
MKHAQQIRDFVVSNFLFGDASALQDDTSFLNSGIVDSTGILELVMFLETTYGIKVDPQEMLPENFDSVSRVAAFVTRKTGEIRQPASLT